MGLATLCAVLIVGAVSNSSVPKKYANFFWHEDNQTAIEMHWVNTSLTSGLYECGLGYVNNSTKANWMNQYEEYGKTPRLVVMDDAGNEQTPAHCYYTNEDGTLQDVGDVRYAFLPNVGIWKQTRKSGSNYMSFNYGHSIKELQKYVLEMESGQMLTYGESYWEVAGMSTQKATFYVTTYDGETNAIYYCDASQSEVTANVQCLEYDELKQYLVSRIPEIQTVTEITDVIVSARFTEDEEANGQDGYDQTKKERFYTGMTPQGFYETYPMNSQPSLYKGVGPIFMMGDYYKNWTGGTGETGKEAALAAFPRLKVYEAPAGGPTVVEVLDIAGIMSTIIGGPFVFISEGFDVTLFNGTKWAFNIGQMLIGIISTILIIVLLLKILDKLK